MRFHPKINILTAVIKMDWQKNILIAAILAVLFTLAVRWHSYQEQHTEAAIGRSASSSVSSAVTADNIPVPTPTVNSNVQATAAPAATSLIKVKTDSLLLDIHTVGGDIVKVALPRHSADLKTPDIPFILLDNTNEHSYKAQSGLIGPNGTDSASGRPTFSTEQKEYELAADQNTLVVDLTYQQDQVKITKRYTFTRGEYVVQVEYLIDNQSPNNWSGQLFGRIVRDNKNFTKTNALALSPFLGGAITSAEKKYQKVTFADLDKASVEINEQGGWVSLVQHYFISAWIPDANSLNNFKLEKLPNSQLYLFGFTGSQITIPPNSQGNLKASFYAGPKDTDKLSAISPYLDLTVDYGWLWMIAKPLFAVLKFMHNHVVANWGVAIILLTLCVKLVFFYPSAVSYKSMAKMRKLAPKMQEMKERYGDDRQKMSQEMMKLYQTEKVNPLGGCLPMLIQMPVFLALYWTLMESVELRHAPFFLWINDLSVMDPYFVLPLLYGVTMWFMQKLNPQPTDPMQARVMQMLPLVFTFMFLWFPAGLVLYWVTNNTLSIAQQYVITKQIENADKA